MMQKFGLFLSLVWLSTTGVSRELSAQDTLTPRKLAPGVLRVVEPNLQPAEAFSTIEPLYDLNAEPFQPETVALSDTLAVQAAGVILRRDVWGLEFAYKPLRMIEADVPQPSGKMQRKTIWYLMYRLRFNGDIIGSVEKENLTGQTTYEVRDIDPAQSSVDEIRFFPSFVLQASVIDPLTGDLVRKEYLDRVMPTVIKQIQADEDPAIDLHSSVSISAEPIYRRGDDQYPVGREVWGVATWENIDPRTDFVTLQIQGLTNAFRVYQTVDGKSFTHKTLQLNFYRPGDEIDEVQDRIQDGVPLVDDVDEQVEILSVYNLPGPELVTLEVDPNTDRSQLLFTTQTQQNNKLDTLEALALNGGNLPGEVVNRLENLGYDISGSDVTAVIEGQRWELTASRSGQSALLRINLEPKLWRKLGTRFEFTDSLESFWLYR